jgi:hypothetical protein
MSWLTIPLGCVALTIMLLVLNSDIMKLTKFRLCSMNNQFDDNFAEKEKTLRHKYHRNMFCIIAFGACQGK